MGLPYIFWKIRKETSILNHMDKRALERITKSGKWEGVDLSSISPAIVNKVEYGRDYKLSTLIGYAAQQEKLDKFPKKLFNLEGISKTNRIGENALHLAAICKQIKYIPQEMLNKKNLGAKNRDGTSPIQYATLHLCLAQIPKKFLTKELLTKVNCHGFGALDFALFAFKECQINPLENTLATTLKEIDAKSPTKSIGPNKDLDKDKELPKILRAQLSIILGRLDTQTLKDYLKEPAISYIRDWRAKIIQQELHQRLITKAFEKNEKTIAL